MFVVMNIKGLSHGSSQFRKWTLNLGLAWHGPARHQLQFPDRYAYIENEGFGPLLGPYIIAILDNATFAAAELGPRMSVAQMKGIIMSIIISRGMMIPGNNTDVHGILTKNHLEGRRFIPYDWYEFLRVMLTMKRNTSSVLQTLARRREANDEGCIEKYKPGSGHHTVSGSARGAGRLRDP
jgi:hypothetical protein